MMNSLESEFNIERIKSRMVLYNFLASAFNYPDKELAEGLSSGEFLSALKNTIFQKIIEDSMKLNIYIGSNKDDILLQLERDYTWLFFTSKPRVAYLFGSVYNEGKLYQESTFKITRLYYETGLKLNESFGLPPDHIAVELEFMAYLAFNQIKAVNENNMENAFYGKEMEKIVFEEYLAPFATKVGKSIKDQSKTPFYRTVGEITYNFFNTPLQAYM